MNRRNFLQAGSIAGLGLSLPNYLQLKAEDAIAPNAKAQSVIYIYLPGGFSAQETFDPKPLAPPEYKGPLSHINTNVAGSQFSQYLTNTAKVADKLTVIRSMTHGETAHERGTNNMFTGWRPSPAIQYASIGSIVSHELGVRNNLPPYISVPNVANEFAGAGYLSSSYSSFSLGDNPEDSDFKVRDLRLPDGVDVDRFKQRKSLLDIVNNSNFINSNRENDNLKAVNSFYENAFSMLDAPQSTAAFDLTKENDKTKDRYGRNSAGMRMLLSRRLVEAGVRFVTMTYGGWDMHQNIHSSMQSTLPSFDQAFAALITDLAERGMLDSTLVLVASEFGRTPKINSDAGRDHWPRVFSSVMAGGGVAKGLSYGKSDSTSTDVSDNPVSPESWAATIYHLLGIDYTKHLMAPGDRPIKVIENGFKHIQELLG
tara:strand:+ start:218 stop:1498 length:1281 start_codon:yes stop_codon:yes gene_type:complete